MHRAVAHSVGRGLVYRSKGYWLEYIHWRSRCVVSLSETLYPLTALSIDSTHEDQSCNHLDGEERADCFA